jgi:hypothetical protein
VASKIFGITPVGVDYTDFLKAIRIRVAFFDFCTFKEVLMQYAKLVL